MIDCAPPSACALPETAEEMLAREKELSAHVEALTLFQKIKAEAFCTELALAEEQWGGNSPAASAACSRCITRFLLHKKCKALMTDVIKANPILRRAVFGQLNTYQYSLIFLMKRLFRLNDPALTEEILRLLASNPYRDDASKPYESRWSLAFLIDEVLKAPEDYLRLSQAGLELLAVAKDGMNFHPE